MSTITSRHFYGSLLVILVSVYYLDECSEMYVSMNAFLHENIILKSENILIILLLFQIKNTANY